MNACSSQKTTTETKSSTTSETTTQTTTNTSNQKVIASESFTKLRMGQLTPFGDMMIKLKDVTSDSRCPEGTQCIWAGEAKIIVGMYPAGKFDKDVMITFSPKDVSKSKPMLLFEDGDSQYYAYGLSPYPSQKSKIEKKQYELMLKIVSK